MVSPSLIPYLSCTFHPDCALLFHLCQVRHYYSNSFSIFRNSTSFTEANAYTGTQLKDSYALYGIFISLWGLTPMSPSGCLTVNGTQKQKVIQQSRESSFVLKKKSRYWMYSGTGWNNSVQTKEPVWRKR